MRPAFHLHCLSVYDPWGNLLQKNQIPGKSGEYFQQTVNTKNQFLPGNGFQYDLSGNMTVNGGAGYAYDAENRITSGNGSTYIYDANGMRVQKVGQRVYWYGANNEVLAESAPGSSVSSDEYIFFGGKRIARWDSTAARAYYYFDDHLGTSRVITTDTGSVCYDADYYPWGAEQHVYVDTCPQHYKFTGKERDSESGLDYFGARYYGSTMGRWMSPDWAAKPSAVPYADLADPQTLNLYDYVRNNPLSRADVDGHCDGWGTCVQWVKDFVQAFRTTKIDASKPAYVVNEHTKDSSVALSKSDVKALGGGITAKAQGANSSVGASATFTSTSTTFTAGNTSGTVTDNFASLSATGSFGPERTGFEAKGELLNWGGSLSVGGVELSGNVCLLCAGAGVSAGSSGFNVTAEAGVAGGGFSLSVDGKSVASASQTLDKKSVSKEVPYDDKKDKTQ